MTDLLRSERLPGREAPDRERDARIEALLLTGLDHYFAGRYELAINVWTRVLFLDRAHAKARAYIERARGAVSERQREGDELFHNGAAALGRGDRIAARQFLTSAVERGASGEEALALLHRLDRLETASGELGRASTPAVPARAEVDRASGSGRRDHRIAWVTGGILVGVLIAAVAGGYLWIVTYPVEVAGPRPSPPPLMQEPLPVPSPSELRLLRARYLAGAGRLHDALSLLEGGEPDDVSRAALDELRATIQRRLLNEARGADGNGVDPPEFARALSDPAPPAASTVPTSR